MESYCPLTYFATILNIWGFFSVAFVETGAHIHFELRCFENKYLPVSLWNVFQLGNEDVKYYPYKGTESEDW